MPERKPRKLFLEGMMLLSLLVLSVGGLALWLWLRPNPPAPARVVLPNGDAVSVAGTTFGTNHVFGSALARWLVRTPPVVRNSLGYLLGSRAVVRSAFVTAAPALVVWLESPPKVIAFASMPMPVGWYEACLEDTNGFVSGTGQGLFTAYGGLMPVQFSAFPRRDRTFIAHLYYHDPQGKTKDCGILPVSNPEYRSYPQWQPETLPVTRRAGDVEATLLHFSTGHGGSTTFTALAHGGYAFEFSSNRADGRNESACRLRLRSLSDTNQIWQVDHVELSDATGNVIRSTGMSWSGFQYDFFGFSPGLWTNEAAWKLRCEIKRTKGFAPGELLTFKNVPLGAAGEKVSLGWTTNVNGVTVTLDYFIRRPAITNNTWSSTQLSEASFHTIGFADDLHLDLVETRADDGTNVESSSWSSSGDTQERSFRNVPPDAKSLDFTFAVHRGRWVEFLVKPETGPARFEFPAPPKAKKPD